MSGGPRPINTQQTGPWPLLGTLSGPLCPVTEWMAGRHAGLQGQLDSQNWVKSNHKLFRAQKDKKKL